MLGSNPWPHNRCLLTIFACGVIPAADPPPVEVMAEGRENRGPRKAAPGEAGVGPGERESAQLTNWAAFCLVWVRLVWLRPSARLASAIWSADRHRRFLWPCLMNLRGRRAPWTRQLRERPLSN